MAARGDSQGRRSKATVKADRDDTQGTERQTERERAANKAYLGSEYVVIFLLVLFQRVPPFSQDLTNCTVILVGM